MKKIKMRSKDGKQTVEVPEHATETLFNAGYKIVEAQPTASIEKPAKEVKKNGKT